MNSRKIRIATITVSSALLQNPDSDKAVADARSIFEASGDFEHVGTLYVGDGEEEKLRTMLKDLADKGDVDVIFTIGCTGFGPAERAPEAVNSLIERHASGLVHVLLASSLKHTPYAAVSRPVAGTYKNTLMITLPGGSKAVQENIEALLKDDLVQRCVSYMTGVRFSKDS
jgi:gephyrin